MYVNINMFTGGITQNVVDDDDDDVDDL